MELPGLPSPTSAPSSASVSASTPHTSRSVHVPVSQPAYVPFPSFLALRTFSNTSLGHLSLTLGSNPRRNVTPRNRIVPSSPSPSPRPSTFLCLSSKTTPHRPSALPSDDGVDQNGESPSMAPSSPPFRSPDLSAARSSIIGAPTGRPVTPLTLPHHQKSKKKRVAGRTDEGPVRKALCRRENIEADCKKKEQTQGLAKVAVSDAPDATETKRAGQEQLRRWGDDKDDGGDDEDEQYPVDCILDHRLEGHDGVVKLLVKWGGEWHAHKPTWEDEASLWDTCRQVVLRYWQQKGQKNRRTKMLSLDPHNGPFTSHRILKVRQIPAQRLRAQRRRIGNVASANRSRLEYLVDYVGYARPEWQPERCLPAALIEEWDRASASQS